MIGAALLYSLNVIRISDYAGQTDPLRLTAVKATVEALLSWSIVAVSVGLASGGDDSFVSSLEPRPDGSWIEWSQTTGQGILDFGRALSTRAAEGTLSWEFGAKLGGAVTWAGLMCTALVVALQSHGQRWVQPSDANLLYSLQPLCTAWFASWLLGEQLDTKGLVGGGIILAAVLLVASKHVGDDSTNDDDVDSKTLS